MKMMKALLRYLKLKQSPVRNQFHFSTKAKYQILYLTEYSQLFEDSGMMEKVIPREIAN